MQQTSTQLVVSEMGLTEQNIERRRRLVALDSADLARIASIRDLVAEHADELTASFFTHLTTLDEAKALVGNRALLERARHMKRDHLIAMVQGEYGKRYVEQRLELALIYSRAGLDTRVFLAKPSCRWRRWPSSMWE
jgi:rsbT co-antagonist protein RsbR